MCFIDWRYIHSWLVFSTQLVNCFPMDEETILVYCCPSTFSLTSPPLPPPQSKRQYSINRQCVAVGGGSRWVLSCVVDHILQEYYTLFLTRFRTYTFASLPQTKMTSKDDIRGLVSLKFFWQWFDPTLSCGSMWLDWTAKCAGQWSAAVPL
jgi:hypothetical protein